MVIVCLAYCLPQLPHHAPGVLEAKSLASLAPLKLDQWTLLGERFFRQLAENSGTVSTSDWVAPSAALPTTPPPLEKGTEECAARKLPSKTKGNWKRSSKALGC